MSAFHKVCLLSVLVRAVLTSASLNIFGSRLLQPIIEGMATSFQLSRGENVSYTPILVNETLPLIRNSSQHPPTIIINSQTLLVPNTSIVFPLYGFPVVFPYNLGPNAPSAQLNLSQEALIGIFLGTITRWNDTNITDVNPALKAVNPPIDQPILRFVNELITPLAEGMSIMRTPGNVSSISINQIVATRVDLVSAQVITTPFAIGATWMAEVLKHSATIALLENHEGIYARAQDGMPFALSELRALYDTTARGTALIPHNLRGRLVWPIVGILYLVIPNNYSSCHDLAVTQRFANLLLFQEEAARLTHFMGWEPAIPALLILDHSLGSVADSYDYAQILYSIPCNGSNALVVHDRTLAASQDLWPFALKMLVAYAEINPFLKLGSATTNISTIMNEIKVADTEVDTNTDIDLAMTWEVTINEHNMTGIPVYMGSVVPVVNLPVNINLSTSVLAAIFSGNITYWKDSRIAEINDRNLLPDESIRVFAAPMGQADSSTFIFAKLLGISWSSVNTTVSSEKTILEQVEFENYSIGYDFSYNLAEVSVQVPALLAKKAPFRPVTHSSASLAACWTATDHPNCWPMATPVSLLPRPVSTSKRTCLEQKSSVEFVQWTFLQETRVDPYLVPNGGVQSMGTLEFCNGRSLLRTIPEPQEIPHELRTVVQVVAGTALVISFALAIALAVARNNNNLKSASVLFSFLAMLGIYLMLVTPFLAVSNFPGKAHCVATMWLITIGFSLTYGSLFAKLFRLYKIFTSRSLVVPRLSNRKLFYVVGAFVSTDVFLLIIYSLVDSLEPVDYPLYIPFPDDLVTGERHLTWKMCDYHQENPMFNIIAVYKLLIALGGTAMAFSIRQVDRRFSAVTALGWAFYNMFLTVFIAVILVFSFNSTTSRVPPLSIIIFCGMWVVVATLAALALDSNVLLACRDFSRPLRRLMQSKNSKDSNSKDKDSKDNNNSRDRKSVTNKKDSKDDIDPKRSYSSTVFVINREMFPARYEDFEPELLDKILEEINFQRTAVRRALASKGPPTGTSTTGTTTCAIELTDLPDKERQRGSTKFDARKFNRTSTFNVNEKASFDAKNSFEGSSRPVSQIAAEPPSPMAADSDESTNRNGCSGYTIAIDAPQNP